MEDKMTLGQRIKSIRQSQGITQSDVENTSGLKREYLSKIENDELDNPTKRTLEKIAKAINTTAGSLIDGDFTNEERQSKSQIIKDNIKSINKELAKNSKEIDRLVVNADILIKKRNFNTSLLSALCQQEGSHE